MAKIVNETLQCDRGWRIWNLFRNNPFGIKNYHIRRIGLQVFPPKGGIHVSGKTLLTPETCLLSHLVPSKPLAKSEALQSEGRTPETLSNHFVYNTKYLNPKCVYLDNAIEAVGSTSILWSFEIFVLSNPQTGWSILYTMSLYKKNNRIEI